METVFHALKDAMVVLKQLINVLLVNLDLFLPEPDVSRLVLLIPSEMPTIPVRGVMLVAKHALLPISVLYAQKKRALQLTAFAQTVSLSVLHAQLSMFVHHANKGLYFSTLSALIAAQEDLPLSTEFVDVHQDSFNKELVFQVAHQDLQISTVNVKNVQLTVLNALELSTLVQDVKKDLS
jgi:hypothetical protein